MADAFTLRACRAEDLAQVHALLTQLADFTHGVIHTDVPLLEELFRQMEQTPEIYHNLVAVQAGEVIGFISIIFYKTLFHTGGTALINELVVDAAWRGAGVGKALIEATVAEAKRRGMDEVEVGTEQENLSAQKFYHRCGFDEEYVLLSMEF